MKYPVFHPIILLMILLSALNWMLEQSGTSIPLVGSYMDDLFCFPIYLSLALSVIRMVIPDYRLTSAQIWGSVVLFAIYFEWWLPTRSAIYTADLVDVIAYALGAAYFSWKLNSCADQQPNNGSSISLPS